MNKQEYFELPIDGTLGLHTFQPGEVNPVRELHSLTIQFCGLEPPHYLLVQAASLNQPEAGRRFARTILSGGSLLADNDVMSA